MLLFVMTSSTGESDSGPGASTPDEPVPGQTHDHPPRRDVIQRWTVTGRQHSPLPHPPELLRRHPSSGGELSARTPACQHSLRDHWPPPLTCSLRSRPLLPTWTPTTCLCWKPRVPCLSGGVWVPVMKRWMLPNMWWASWAAVPARCRRARNQVGVHWRPIHCMWDNERRGTGLSMQLQKEGASLLCVNIIFMSLMAALYFC